MPSSVGGKRIKPLDITIPVDAIRRKMVKKVVRNLCLIENKTLFLYNFFKLLMNDDSFLTDFSDKNLDDIDGTSVKATNKLAPKENAMVNAIGMKISATNPSIKNIGRKTAAVVIVDATIAPLTSLAP